MFPPMRLCFVADPHHPNTDRWASHFAESLGHDVTIIATIAGPYQNDRRYALVPCPIRTRFDYLTLGLRIKSLIRRIRPDVLIGYRIQSNGLAAAMSGFRPLVLAAQSEVIVWPPSNPVLNAGARFAIRRADLLQAWGSHIARRMVELGADPSKILVLPRGVDVELFKPPQTPETAPILIVTRALRAVYRHETLIKAFREVLGHIPRAKLVIAGDGAERRNLTRLSAELGLDSSVSFLGHLSPSALADCLRGARCYVTLVGTEGVSSSLLEAMGCGLLPVVPDLPGNRDWVTDGENGLSLPLGALENSEQIAPLLTRALSDDSLRVRAFEMNASLISRRADWRANMKQMESAYLDLARRSKRQAPS